MSKLRKKPWKIEGLEKALESIPMEERAAAEADIRKVFENFDPKNPPGRPIKRLSPGTLVCPDCGGKLVEVVVAHGNRFLDCESCDTPFGEKVDA